MTTILGAGSAQAQIPSWDVASSSWLAGHNLTAGQIIFALASGAIGADAGLIWDNTDKYLAINTPSPFAPLHVSGITDIAILTDTAASATVTSAGGLRINSNTPLGDVHLMKYSHSTGAAADYVAFQLQDDNATTYLHVDVVTGGGHTAGRVGIANTAPNDLLDVAGNIVPHTDLGGALGSTTYRWTKLNAKTVQVFSTAALTGGSVGSLQIPVNEGSTVSLLTDALAGNVDGCCGLLYDSTGTLYKFGGRVNGLWKHVALAGYSIPNDSGKIGTDGTLGVDETICPVCKNQMRPGQAFGFLADKWENGRDSSQGLHGVPAHLKCLITLDDE